MAHYRVLLHGHNLWLALEQSKEKFAPDGDQFRSNGGGG